MAWWLTQHLATVAVLAAIVHLTTRLVRASPGITHLLWTIVLIKLVLPPVLAWPWSIGIAEAPARSSEAEWARVEMLTSRTAGMSAAISGSMSTSEAASIEIARARATAPDWRAWAWIVWMMGTGAFALVHGTRTWRMHRVLRYAQAAPERLQQQLDAIAGDMSMPRVEVRLAQIASPLVWGGLRPVILWPASLPASIHGDAVAGLLAHELAHLRRRDHWIGWLELAAGCAWWWNPLFWHVRRHVRANAELACDAWVAEMAPRGRRHYAEALLVFSAGPSSLPAPMPAIGVRSGNRRLMERRLAMIMRAHVPVRLSRLALCTAGLVAALALPAWAQRQAPAATPQASQPAPRPGPATTSAERPVTPPIPAESGAVVQQTRGVRASAAQPVPITPVATTARGDGRTFQAAIPVDVQYVSSDEADLPSDARELVRKFSQTTAQTRREAEEAIARERSGVIEQLQKMQDAETKAGHLDQALAIRARIRVLQSGGRVQYSAAYSTVTTPDWSGSWEGFVAAPPPPPPPAPVRPAVPPTPAAAPPPPPAPRP